MKDPFVSSITAPDEVKEGEKTKISIQGNWPTPSWSHNETTIDYDENNNIVKVRYLGVSKGGMAIQVLQPFSDSFTLQFPSKGKWKIVVGNRGDNIELELDVE